MIIEAFTIATALGVSRANSLDLTVGSNSMRHYDYHDELPINTPQCEEAYDFFNITVQTGLSYPFLSKMAVLATLDKFTKLQENWDCRGGHSINSASVENVKSVIKSLPHWDTSLWQIAPGVNGDIFINYKGSNKLASIVISSTTYSYFIEADDLVGDEQLPFDEIEVNQLMQEIANV